MGGECVTRIFFGSFFQDVISISAICYCHALSGWSCFSFGVLVGVDELQLNADGYILSQSKEKHLVVFNILQMFGCNFNRVSYDVTVISEVLNFSYKRSPYHDREEGDGGDITKITPPVMPLSATQTNKYEMNFFANLTCCSC